MRWRLRFSRVKGSIDQRVTYLLLLLLSLSLIVLIFYCYSVLIGCFGSFLFENYYYDYDIYH